MGNRPEGTDEFAGASFDDGGLMTTFPSVAENSGFSFTAFESKASGKLEKVDGEYMISEIVVFPVLTIIDPDDLHRARRILEKAEGACLISHSVRSRILFRPEILVAEL